LRWRYAVVSSVVPVAAGIIATYAVRQHAVPVPPAVSSTLGSVTSRLPQRWQVLTAGMTVPIPTDARIRTRAQASSRALEVAHGYGAIAPTVVTVELLTLREAITRTQRDDADEIDLAATGYGESARTMPAWRVQLDHAMFGPGVAPAAMLPTAILVLAAGCGMLIDMTLGYPIP
jgi:hypothetical protein